MQRLCTYNITMLGSFNRLCLLVSKIFLVLYNLSGIQCACRGHDKLFACLKVNVSKAKQVILKPKTL